MCVCRCPFGFGYSNQVDMPGNQASPDRNGDLELKVSYMVKRSQGKSALGAVNFKKRVFVLTPNRLTYFDGTLEVNMSVHLCTLEIFLQLFILECLLESIFTLT